MEGKKRHREHLGNKDTSKYGSDLAVHSKHTISQQPGRKVGLHSWEGPLSVRAQPCHLKNSSELGIQSLEVAQGSAGNRGGN